MKKKIFKGYIEEYTQSWTHNGQYGYPVTPVSFPALKRGPAARRREDPTKKHQQPRVEGMESRDLLSLNEVNVSASSYRET